MVERVVGSGIGGGVLVRDSKTGRTREVKQSREGQLSDPGRTRAARSGSRSERANAKADALTAANAEKSRLAAEASKLKAQDSAIKGIQERAERQRQNELRRTTGQVRTGGTISEFQPSEFQLESGFRRGGFEATKSFITQGVPRFVTNLGPALSNALLGDTTKLKEINPFKTFKDVGPQSGEKVVSFEPQFGTVSSDAPTGVIGKTGFDILKERRSAAGVPERLVGSSLNVISTGIASDIEKQVTTQFQGNVDRGELNVDDAQLQAQTEFQSQFQQRASGLSGLGGDVERERSGKTISRQVQSALPVAAIVAAPFTGSTSLVAAAGIGSAGLGLRSGQQSLEAGLQGDFGRSALKLGEAGLFAFGSGQLISGALGPGASSIVGKQITSARIGQLESKPFSFGGAEIGAGPRGTITELSLSKTTGFAAQEVDVFVPAFSQGVTKSGAERFSIVGGRFSSTSRVQPFNLPSSKDVIKFSEQGSFIGRGGSGTGARLVGRASSIEVGEDIVSSIGTIDLIRGGKNVRTGFGGIAKRGDDSLDFITGSPSKIGIQRGGDQFKIAVQPRGGGNIRLKPSDIVDISPQGSSLSGGLGSGPSLGSFTSGGGVRTGQSLSSGFSPIGGGAKSVADQLGAGSIQAGVRAANVGSSQSLNIASFAPGLSDVSIIGARGVQRFGSLGLFKGGTQSQLVAPRSIQAQESSLGLSGSSFGIGQTLTTIPRVNVLEQTTTGATITSGLSLTGSFSRGRSGQDVFTSPRVDVITSPRLDTRLEQGVDLDTRQQQRTRQFFDQGFAPSVTGPGFGRPRGGQAGFGLGLPGAFFGLPTFGEFPQRKKGAKKSARKKTRIAPSLTGLTLFDLGGVTGGPLPQGSTPSLRLVPESFLSTSKPKKKKKGKKKKK